MTAGLEPTGNIVSQPWLTAPETRTVVAAFAAAGAEMRFVGGCVRDAVLKRPIKDIDIATPELPGKVVALLEAAAIKAVPTGLGHGTVTAVIGKAHFQITTLRLDVETDGRRAKVAFTDDWAADAGRRDFVINTLSSTPGGDVYDPFGALEDLGDRLVRFVGIPKERIEEDVLRLLRFFRFHAAYGNPPPDPGALAACREMAHRLPELSGERVREEMFQILLGPDPADIAQLMRGERILEHILPEAGDVGRLRMLCWLDSRAVKIASVVPDPLRRLAALLEAGKGGAAAVAARFRLSNKDAARLTAMMAAPFTLSPESKAAARRRALHQAGAETVRDLVLLNWAGEMAVTPRRQAERSRQWIELLGAADEWTVLEFPLKGGDAAALGVPEGPRIGQLLGAVESWWQDGDFTADRRACLDKLESLLAAEPAAKPD